MRSIAPRARSAISGSTVDHVLPVAERVAQLLERDHLHVPADRRLGHGLEALVRAPPCCRRWRMPVSVAIEEALLRRGLREADHALGREDVRPAVRERHALARAAALGVDEQLGVGRVVAASARCPPGGCPRGRGTRPARSLSLRPGDPLEPDAEEHVRAGTGSRGRPGSPRSPPSRCRTCSSSRSRPSPRRSCSRTRRRPRRGARPSTSRSWSAVIDAASEQPASRSGISTVFSGREDRRRLGHEVDAAEDDRLGVGRRRLAREAERVADVVGHVLHLGHLVVVGEDHRVALARQRAAPRPAGGVIVGASRHSTSRETSSERAPSASARRPR